MTTDTASDQARQGRAEARSELWLRVGAVCFVGAICVLVSAVAAGRTGLWGSLMGLALVLLFFGSSAWVMTRTRHLEPALVLVIALSLYLLKMIGFALVVVALSVLDLLGDPLNRAAVALAIIAGALTWSGAEIVAAVRRRQPVFDVGRDAP